MTKEMNNSNTKLLIIQDKHDNNLTLVSTIEEIFNCGKALYDHFNEKYNLENVIIVINKDYQYAQDYLETYIDEDPIFGNSVILLEDFYYEKYGDDGSIYIGLEFVDEGDALILCRPSTCFGYNADENTVGVKAEYLQVFESEDLMKLEEELAEKVNSKK